MKRHKAVVLFNASVIIAGMYNPRGGSGKILKWVREKKIIGVASEVILNEVKRHVVKSEVDKLFLIISPPAEETVRKYNSIVADQGDSHVLASAAELEADYLVSLDKKHILALKDKIKRFTIVSPKELIEKMFPLLHQRE